MTQKQKVASWLAGAAIAITGGLVLTHNTTTKPVFHRYEISPGSYGAFPVHPSEGDTVVLKAGNYGYINASNISGSSKYPINLITQGQVNLHNGFAFFDCKHWKIDGKNTMFIGNNPNTVAINIQGKSGDFDIGNIKFADIYSCVWFKTEAYMYPDSTYWHGLVMDTLFLHDLQVNRCHFEAFYLGSTGQNADRPCKGADGKTYYPLPARIRNIKMINIVSDSSDRTQWQMSGLDGGKNVVKNCTFRYAGLSHEVTQGAIGRIGGNSWNIVVDSCIFDGSWLYAFQSQASGVVRFTNNTVNNATKIGIVNPEKMAAVELDGYKYPITFKIKNNKIGFSNSGVGILITTPAKLLTDSCVYINNTGLFQNNSGKIFRNE